MARSGEGMKFSDEEFRLKHPAFYHTLHEKCPSLTAHQMLICAMIRDEFLSYEIAAFLKISERTVESHRRDIRKKINLKKGELTGFLTAI
jgi:AraC family chitin signaling transcriptional activator